MDVLHSNFCRILAVYIDLWPLPSPSSYTRIVRSNSAVFHYQLIGQKLLCLDTLRAIFDRAWAISESGWDKWWVTWHVTQFTRERDIGLSKIPLDACLMCACTHVLCSYIPSYTRNFKCTYILFSIRTFHTFLPFTELLLVDQATSSWTYPYQLR